MVDSLENLMPLLQAGVVHRPRLLGGNQALRCPNLTASGLAQWRRERVLAFHGAHLCKCHV